MKQAFGIGESFKNNFLSIQVESLTKLHYICSCKPKQELTVAHCHQKFLCMQDRDLEDLALDLKELLFLLKEAKTQREFVPVVERHINRLTKTLEEIRNDLNTSKNNVPVSQQEIVAAIEEEITIHIEQQITPLEEGKQKKEEKEPQEITTPPATVLGEQLRPAAELSKGLTLNDTFRFSRELFNGDKDAMNRALQEISRMNSLADVMAYLSSRIEWDEEQDTVKDFIEVLKKYFV